MANTNFTTVAPSDGWKAVKTGVGGVFSATSSCLYLISTSQPASSVKRGHRLSNGDLEKIVLKTNETLYVKVDVNTVVIFSDSGVGFLAERERLKSIGLNAEAVQPYVELNCKNGVQWSFDFYNPNLAASTGVSYLHLVTGAKPIGLKARVYSFDGLGIQTSVYRNPVINTSTDLTSLIYNMNDRNPATLLSTIASVTVTSEGELWIPSRTFIGNTQSGSKVETTIDPDLTGLETWFAENSSYLIKTNTIDSSNSQRVTTFGTFYEGFPDLP